MSWENIYFFNGEDLPDQQVLFVVFVGNGVNDAPAITRADIGVSLHKQQTLTKYYR